MSATQPPKDSTTLSLPEGAGRSIVETAAVIACPLLGTDNFVRFCKERGVDVKRERLLRLERLGVFAPVFRVRMPPEEETPNFFIPLRPGNNWFDKGWAWDTTAVPSSHAVPEDKEESQEAYYSIFQIEYLHFILIYLTMPFQMDGFVTPGEQKEIDWNKVGGDCLNIAKDWVERFRAHEYRRAVALLCQYISTRYYPRTQGDKRTIHTRHGHYSDQWITVFAPDWDWNREAREWDPKTAETLFELTPAKLSHAYRTLAHAQADRDPLQHWYQLLQFVAVREKERLKGDALLAATLRSGAHMLRLLHKDLYGEELPHPNEVMGTVITHVPELAVREDPRRHLEFVVNRFRLNPQPALCLIVEGPSEEAAITKIFQECYGAHPGAFAIEFVVLGGVDHATGTEKEDRFRAIMRLVDYLHHHQTLTFLILDNERYARKLKAGLRTARSTYGSRRHVTRADYIRIWKQSFEFDNFSCTEIASAMTALAHRPGVSFTTREVTACKRDPNPGARLTELYRRKAGKKFNKLSLVEALTTIMLAEDSRRKIGNRPILKTLNRVAQLAIRNPFPTMHELWEKNQASKFLGTKRPGSRRKTVTSECEWKPGGRSEAHGSAIRGPQGGRRARRDDR